MDCNENIAFFAWSARCFFALVNFPFFVNHTPRYLYDCVFSRIVLFHEYTCVSVSFPKTVVRLYINCMSFGENGELETIIYIDDDQCNLACSATRMQLTERRDNHDKRPTLVECATHYYGTDQTVVRPLCDRCNFNGSTVISTVQQSHPARALFY